MTIKNLGAFVDGLWDWGSLNTCFTRPNVEVGDVDGIVNNYRSGRVLVLEGKPLSLAPPIGEKWLTDARQKDARQKNGQVLLWRDLSRLGITTLLLYGDGTPRVPFFMQLWRSDRYEPDPVTKSSWEEVHMLVSEWWKWADDKASRF